jgi:arsenate reductase-like glutaredoxin family protein
LPNAIKEAFGSVETYASIKELEDKYKIKLSFLVILIAINELEEDDVADYLTIKFKVSPAIAKNIKEELVKNVLDPTFIRILNSKPAVDSIVDKEDIINLFSKRIIETLNAPADVIQGLNISIFKLLNEDDSLEEKIIELLYNNNEILTSGSLLIDDREVQPTISNWLKDFIKINGSELFDELKLVEYLSNSINAKKLKPEEKDLLRKLLKLYQNLAFFPESMDNIPIEDWQIFPTEKFETEPKINKSKVFQDALDDSQAIKTPIKTQTKAKIYETKISEPNPLDELEQSLSQYSPGTLEHKAVTQEIGRLNKKTKK